MSVFQICFWNKYTVVNETLKTTKKTIQKNEHIYKTVAHTKGCNPSSYPKCPRALLAKKPKKYVILEGDEAGGLAVDTMLEQVYNGHSHLCKLLANNLVESEE
jgi:hypothetical protein